MNRRTLPLFFLLGGFVAQWHAFSQAGDTPTISNQQIAGHGPISWSIANWKEWRDKQITLLLTPTFKSDSGEMLLSREEVIARANNAYNFIKPILDQDPDFFSRNTERAHVIGNFIKFVTAQHWMALADGKGISTHGLGLTVEDVTYWSIAQQYVGFPDLLKSQPFLEAMSNASTYRVAVDMIAKQNQTLPPNRKWIVLPFLAQFVQSVDGLTYGRMLILVPNVPAPRGGLVDKWVLFSIATPDLAPDLNVQSVSMISVYQKSVGKGFESYPVDFLRQRDPQTKKISIVPTVLTPERPSKNCYDCHKTSIVPIYPALEYRFNSNGTLVPKSVGVGIVPAQVNQLILGYGAQSYAGVEDLDAYGPSLGPIDWKRSDKDIQRIAQSLGITLSPLSYVTVKSAMNCVECHDSSFSRINYLQAARSNRDPLAFERHEGLLQTYIEEGWMPPGPGPELTTNTLTLDERKVLWKALTMEYLDLDRQSGIFVDWLRGKVSSP
jgi:hypothetical protein